MGRQWTCHALQSHVNSDHQREDWRTSGFYCWTHSVYTWWRKDWGESQNLEGYTENSLHHYILWEEYKHPWRQWKTSVLCEQNLSHCPPQMLGHKQARLPVLFPLASFSMKVSCSTSTKAWVEMLIWEPISQASWNFSHHHSPTHLNSLLLFFFFFSFLSQALWQASSLFLVPQSLPHSTWTAEPSHKIRIMNNVHRRCMFLPLGLAAWLERHKHWQLNKSHTATEDKHSSVPWQPSQRLQPAFPRLGAFLFLEGSAPLQQQGCKGAVRCRDAQQSERRCCPLWSSPCVTPHAIHVNIHFQLLWPGHRKGTVILFQHRLPLAT